MARPGITYHDVANAAQQHCPTQNIIQVKPDEQNKSFIELQAPHAVSSQQLMR